MSRLSTIKAILTLGLNLIVMAAIQAHPGVGIVNDSKGNIYYTDLKHIWKIDTLGRKSIAVPHVHSHELYMDEHDNLYGEHLWYNGEARNTWGHFVWRYSATGKFEKVKPDTIGFLEDYSFVRDRAGNMYQAHRDDHCQRIAVIDSHNKKTIKGTECLDNIRWMTVTPQGVVYLIDLDDLKRVDRDGTVETISSSLAERSLTQFFVNDPHQIMGLDVDAVGNTFVAVYSARKVKKVTPFGRVSTLLETSAAWSPTGVLSVPNGDLWILECSPTNAVRVERLTADGRRIVY